MSERNLKRDHRRWRLLLLLASAALLAVLAAAAWREHNTPWRVLQRQYLETRDRAKDDEMGIRQLVSCDGEVDRCPTCHLEAVRQGPAVSSIPRLFRPHGPGLGHHDPQRMGCSACHGGNGRALNPRASHAAPGAARDPLMTEPHLQASCARCHVPGDKPGQERLLEGAGLYAGLGCPVCHPLTDQGLGGLDFGPDLRGIGRKSPAYLETSLVDPAANFAGSTMPSFRLALGESEAAMESLVIYLESLALPRARECRDRDRSRSLAEAPCASCHGGEGGRAQGRKTHLCPYLLERKAELRCAGCHPKEIPPPGAGKGYCPLVKQHREACAVCHERGEEVVR
jgi:hypothetical protein